MELWSDKKSRQTEEQTLFLLINKFVACTMMDFETNRWVGGKRRHKFHRNSKKVLNGKFSCIWTARKTHLSGQLPAWIFIYETPTIRNYVKYSFKENDKKYLCHNNLCKKIHSVEIKHNFCGSSNLSQDIVDGNFV